MVAKINDIVLLKDNPSRLDFLKSKACKNWLSTFSNEELQVLQKETTDLLLERSNQETKQANEHLVDLSVVLRMLGQRKTQGCLKFIIEKLEKHNGKIHEFDELIQKLEHKLK